ncbi:uncharacterized protein LOC106160879 [Lingula anatina]|uniref:Uncharacterized protein LOC106160879 n=1 Tax=Lingula anatina TaxID=7574 RepID=A0A1S3I5J0_LINAN|nr:uncharacterized protein LOC106160879 [Lingula anatina]|eukprot:XP_013393106.1 uncharacterized protein LOC106160879 [Lingula anatina]
MPPLCGNNTRCCRIDKNNVTICKNTPSPNSQGIAPCPKPWSCICVPEEPLACPELTTQCPDVQQVTCDGTAYTFTDSHQFVAVNLAPLRYYISYSGCNDVIISTCNTAGYDTKLALFACDALSNTESGGSQTCNIYQEYSLYNNDDDSRCSGFTSLIQIPEGELASGTYAIGVYGYDTREGTFTVSITC